MLNASATNLPARLSTLRLVSFIPRQRDAVHVGLLTPDAQHVVDLAHLGITEGTPPEPVKTYEALHMYDVFDRDHVDDTFTRAWASFDPLKKGDLIGVRHDGTRLTADADGCILFPDAKAEMGNEWFYLAKTIKNI